MPEYPGEGMTGTEGLGLPQPIYITLETLYPQQNSHFVPRPQPVCAGPDHGRDRSSSQHCVPPSPGVAIRDEVVAEPLGRTPEPLEDFDPFRQGDGRSYCRGAGDGDSFAP